MIYLHCLHCGSTMRWNGTHWVCPECEEAPR